MSNYSQKQQENFANNSNPSKGISLCIPRVFNNITHKRVKQHMIEANLGFVERVDLIHMGDFKRAFVHFAPNKWNMRDTEARNALTALQSGKKIRIEYESPWFWLVGISGAVRPVETPQHKPHKRKIKIDIITESNKPLKYNLALQPDIESGIVVRKEDDPILARMQLHNYSFIPTQVQTQHLKKTEELV